MAITRAETQVTFSGPADNATVSAAGSQTSLEVNLDQTCFAAQISMKTANGGSPVAADQIYVWLLQSSGDPDGGGTDEFDTNGHARLLAVLNTSTEATAIKTVELPLPQKGLKVRFEGATTTTTQNIVVSATITELRQSS